jgi:hypothetical protein
MEEAIRNVLLLATETKQHESQYARDRYEAKKKLARLTMEYNLKNESIKESLFGNLMVLLGCCRDEPNENNKT